MTPSRSVADDSDRSIRDESGGPGTEDTDATERPSASDAFQALGGETRTAIVRSLADDEPLAFSDLFARREEDTSAGFAYHLRQVTDQFVRQRDDERYELTDAGRAVARDLAAGTFTASVDRDPVPLDEDCPLCGTAALVAGVDDNVTEVTCTNCEGTLLRLSLPPGGYADRDPSGFAAAVDAHHRRRIDSFADGVCPDCAGPVERTVEPVDGGSEGYPVEGAESNEETATPVQAQFACETCGDALRCPVTLTLRSHPAVVAFYHDHGVDVDDRPVWNVGPEWRERLLSTDPLCVVVSTKLDDECLFLYVAADGRVIEHRRQAAPDSDAVGVEGQSGDDGPDDDPDGGDSRPVGTAEAREVDPPATGDSDLDHASATDGATA